MPLDFSGGPLAPDRAPTLAYGVCDDDLTGLAGLGVGVRLARFLGLPEQLAVAVRLQRRRRSGRAGQLLLARTYAACAGGGHLHTVAALRADDAARRACGLRAGPASWRLGADLQRMHQAALEGLRQCARLVPLGAQACGQRWGSVPVCGDGPGIEGEGQLCEHAERGYHGEKQSWLHSVCVGAAWVSVRLHAGGTDVRGDGREQLDRDAVPWLTGRQPVGLRAASADSCKELVSYCRQRGGDDSVSAADPRQKAPILCLAAAMGLREDGGASGHGGEGAGHRGQQRPEPACQGPLTDLGLQPPLCRSPAAQQGFYLGGQIAQQLLPYQVLPSAARQPGLRPLIRYCVGSVGRLQRLCSRSNLRLDWLLPAAWPEGAGLGLGRCGRSRAGPSGRGPTRSPQVARCARSRGRRTPAGVPKSLGDGLRGPCRVRRALRSSPTVPNRHFGELTGNLEYRPQACQ